MHDVGTRHDLGAGLSRHRDEQCVKLDAPDHQRGRTVGFDHGRVAVGPLEIEPRHGVRRNAPQLGGEIRKARERAGADAAAARLVARKGGAIEEADRDSARRQGSRGCGPGRSGADDDHRHRPRSSRRTGARHKTILDPVNPPCLRRAECANPVGLGGMGQDP